MREGERGAVVAETALREVVGALGLDAKEEDDESGAEGVDDGG